MAIAFFSAGRWSKKFAAAEETRWAAPFLEMAQFSIAGYAFNGLTINVGYIDLYYILLAFVVLLISCNTELLARKHSAGLSRNNFASVSLMK